MGRILSLDYGDKHIGVAVSDPLGSFAMPLKTIIKKDVQTIKPAVKEIGELIKTYDVVTILIGYPKNMDDSIGERGRISEDFADRLKRNFKKVEIVLWDERLTTLAAKEILSEQNIHGKKQKEMVDSLAASILLNDYMESKK